MTHSAVIRILYFRMIWVRIVNYDSYCIDTYCVC